MTFPVQEKTEEYTVVLHPKQKLPKRQNQLVVIAEFMHGDADLYAKEEFTIDSQEEMNSVVLLLKSRDRHGWYGHPKDWSDLEEEPRFLLFREEWPSDKVHSGMCIMTDISLVWYDDHGLKQEVQLLDADGKKLL
jgi:hypothetical protein